MYYQENFRKARDYLTKRQKQLESLNRKPNLPQITSIRQIFAIIRTKERNDSENRQIKILERKEDNCTPLIVITSQSPEQKDQNHNISAKLLRLNKITRNKTEITPYNFIDKIVEPIQKRQETKSEQTSPLRVRKTGNATERKYCITKEIGHKKFYHVQQNTQGLIPQTINSELSSPVLRLNKTSYQNNDKTKIEKPKNQEIQLIRRISGWTIQSQESIQAPF